jgi:autotransporter-associated beta strand protein
MKNAVRLSSSLSLPMHSRRLRLRFPFSFMTVAMLLLRFSTASSSYADSATWRLNPISGDWNTANNWTPPTVPNGPADIATFASSNITDVSLSALTTTVNALVFNAGASPFTITLGPTGFEDVELVVVGVGITNNSGITQNFVTDSAHSREGRIFFQANATAGNGTFTNAGGATIFTSSASAANGNFTNNGARLGHGGNRVVGRGTIEFRNTSTAGNGTFVNKGSRVEEGFGGDISFFDASTAGNGAFTNNGAVVFPAFSASTQFHDNSTAGNGTFFANAGTALGGTGGILVFRDTSSASNATLIANGGINRGISGGSIAFFEDSTGDTARVEVFGNGFLDIGVHRAPGVTIGSIEGDGDVFLGANNLTVGSNNLSTNFAGVIQGSGLYASLTKIGTGKLVLSDPNSYTGGTTVKRGRLIINNRHDSGTGTGPVQVNGGRLGGMGIIAGAVTVGSGVGREAVLSPGYHHSSNPGTLTIQSPLTFNADATYEIEVNSSRETMDKVVALGVTINVGAQTLFADLGNGTFTVGSVFTVIDNTSATPIAGTFSNLPDGSTFTSNGNTYQVNYDGGDGNDLTLMVVP